MRRRNGEMQLFGISFLDILACALGGVLLLLVITMQRRAEESRAAHAHVRDLQGRIGMLLEETSRGRATLAAIRGKLDKVNADVEKLEDEKSVLDQESAENQQELELINAQIAAMAKQLDEKEGDLKKKTKQINELATDQRKLLQDEVRTNAELNRILRVLEQKQGEVEQLREGKSRLEERQKIVASLIGLKGQMRNVVFVFDRSGSMNEREFKDYYALLKNWILHLNLESFEVIVFNHQVEVCFEQLQPVDPGLHGNREPARKKAADWIENYQPAGQTNTLGALTTAIQDYPDVDTIIFMSDGRPEYQGQTDRQVLQELDRQNPRNPATDRRRVTINTVAMGNYFAERWGDFLQQIATQHDGVFIGR